MKLLLGVLLALITYVSADCDVLERIKVKHQWHEVFGEHRLEFVRKVFGSFFHDHPETRDIFKRVRGDNVFSPEFLAHGHRVLSGLDTLISLLDDEDTLNAQAEHLKGQHAERNLKGEFFDQFGNHLIDELPEYLGTHLDYDAWHDCYSFLAGKIKS